MERKRHVQSPYHRCLVSKAGRRHNVPSQRIAITPGALGTPQASRVCVQGTELGHV